MKSTLILILFLIFIIPIYGQKVYIGSTLGINISKGNYLKDYTKIDGIYLDNSVTPSYGLNGAFYLNNNISIPFGIKWNFPTFGIMGSDKNLEQVINNGDTSYYGIGGSGGGVNIRNYFAGICIENYIGNSKSIKYHYTILPSINKNLVSKVGLTDMPTTDTLATGAITIPDNHYIWRPSITFSAGFGIYTQKSIIRWEVPYHPGFSLLDSQGLYVRIPYTNEYEYGHIGYNGGFLFTGISYSYKLWEKKNNKG